nr:MAG: hypothetical protein [uncultured archaeon]
MVKYEIDGKVVRELSHYLYSRNYGYEYASADDFQRFIKDFFKLKDKGMKFNEGD